MNVAPGRQILSVMLIPVVAGFCWGHANRFALLLWLFSALPIAAARLWAGGLYARTYADAHAEVQSAFVRLLLPLAMMEGAFWGASVWLFFQRIPVVDQFGCWVILTIQVIGPLARLAFVPRLMRGYISTFFLVGLAAVAYSLKANTDGHPFHLWFVALILFQWFSIQYQAKAFFNDQSKHFGLRHDLAEKERQALEAVKMKNRFLAVGNVLSNAIKYSKPGKQILLAARVLKTGVRIEVWDQGIGIPSDQIDKVFDEFYKVAEGAALSNDGVGLGLSLVARLAKTLSSEVRLDSVAAWLARAWCSACLTTSRMSGPTLAYRCDSPTALCMGSCAGSAT